MPGYMRIVHVESYLVHITRFVVTLGLCLRLVKEMLAQKIILVAP